MAKRRDIGPFETAREARIYLGQKLGYIPTYPKRKRPTKWVHPNKAGERAICQRRKNGPWFIVKYPYPSKGLKVSVNP